MSGITRNRPHSIIIILISTNIIWFVFFSFFSIGTGMLFRRSARAKKAKTEDQAYFDIIYHDNV